MSAEKPDLGGLWQLPQSDAATEIPPVAAPRATDRSPWPQLFSFKGLFSNLLHVLLLFQWGTQIC